MLNDYKEFGKNLRKWRKYKKMSQEELAHLANTNAPTISSYESGCAVPSFKMMLRLASALNIAPVHFFVYDCPALSIQDEELKNILIDKFRNIPFEKRQVIFKVIDAIMSEDKTPQ